MPAFASLSSLAASPHFLRRVLWLGVRKSAAQYAW